MPADTETLARFLIGCTLALERDGLLLSGRIVETEAYVVGDASSHAYRGRTERNASMFAERGTSYVYFIYGTSFCLNVASEQPGIGAAVLIRAVEPICGTELMRAVRGDVPDRDLARGPGRLCRAFSIDRRFDGLDLCAAGPLVLGRAERPVGEIGAGVRIGLSKERDRVLRFYERGSPFVSGPRRLAP